MFRCLALVVIPALALACCPPKMWEATEYVVIGSSGKDGTPHYTEIEQNITVDSAMRRTFIKQSLTTDGHQMMQTILQDFGSGEQYVTNMETGRCERTPINSLEPGCIPANTTKVIQSYMGVGAHRIKTTMYRMMMDKTLVYLTVADDNCIPLAYEASGSTADGGGYQMSVEIVGVTAGVADTAVFETPRMCARHSTVFTGVGK